MPQHRGIRMKQARNVLIILGLIIAAVSVVGSAFAVGTMTTAIPYPYQPTMTAANGNQVYYIITESDGSIHPATAGEQAGIDAAIADGTIAQVNQDRYLARGLN